MKKRQNNSTRASALQITLAVALLSVSAILFASSFKAAAPAAPGRPQSDTVAMIAALQELPNAPATPRQDGFYPPLPAPAAPAVPQGQLIMVSLPTDSFDNSVPIATVIIEPVVTGFVDPSLNYVGFQGDFTFDSTVVSFSNPGPVQKAGLTGGDWNVSGNVLPGPGPMRTLRISAFSNDFTPLNGSGTLFNLKMLRVSSTPGATSPLVWAAPPDNFIYIDADLATHATNQTNGAITITAPGGTPTPTPQPTATATPAPTATATPAPTATATPAPTATATPAPTATATPAPTATATPAPTATATPAPTATATPAPTATATPAPTATATPAPTATATPAPTATATPAPTATATPAPTATPTPTCGPTAQLFTAILSGSQEVPPTGSAGTGLGTVVLNAAQTMITVNLSFSGLAANASAAHVHAPAPPGVNAPVIIPLTGFPAATSGTYSNSFAITPAQVSQLMNGLGYLNIHNATFPGGEIRGQLSAGLGPIIFAYDLSNNHLVSFDAGAPGTLLTDVPLTGLNTGEFLFGIDFRPANGLLYAVASDFTVDRVVTINTITGAVTSVNAANTLAHPAGDLVGLDFNPVPDRLREVTDGDVNLRLNPNDGTLAATDTNLAYVAGDPNFGVNPVVFNVAYNNNMAGATMTTLFGIDANLDILVRIGGVNGTPSPNTGQLTTIGSLGVDTSAYGGFDIQQGTGIAYTALRIEGVSILHTINLTTGQATAIGPIGPTGGKGNSLIDGLSVFLCPPTPTPTPAPTATPTPPPHATPTPPPHHTPPPHATPTPPPHHTPPPHGTPAPTPHHTPPKGAPGA